MSKQKITLTKKEYEHIAEWLPKVCFNTHILKEYEHAYPIFSHNYENAKTEKEKKKIQTIKKKFSKHYYHKKYEWENLSESIINKIQKEYQ